MIVEQPKALTLSPETRLQVPELKSLPEADRLHFSLVIPTYNESKNIYAIVELLTNLLDPVLPQDYELIVVDDNSPDRTWEIAQHLTLQYPQLRVMRRQQERGLSTAVIRGWQVAHGAVLGVIDGDLQHPPEVLLNMLSAISQGADLTVASRHVEGGGTSDWGLARRILSRGAQLLGLVILPRVVGRVSDPMSGYFLVRRPAIANYLLNPLGYKILIEVLGRGNIQTVAEVGYVFQERQSGESKVTWRQYVEYFMHLLRLRSRGRIGRIREKLRFPIKRFLRFGVVGLSGVAVDLAVFYFLRTHVNLPIAVNTMGSAEVAVLNNFLWNDFWTFGDIARQQPGQRHRLQRFVKFNLICLAGILLQALIVSLLHDKFSVNEFIAKLIAIVTVTFWNFWVNLKLSWRVTDIR
jgi:dolichol-phosphate mannosyltransferase